MNRLLGVFIVTVCISTMAHAQSSRRDCPLGPGPFDCGPPTGPVPGPIGPFEPVPKVEMLPKMQGSEMYLLTKDASNSFSVENDTLILENIKRLAKQYDLKASTLYRVNPSAYSSETAASKYRERQLFLFNR